jgi:ribonuclease P protein component
VIADTVATFPPSVRVRTPTQYQATFSQGRRISAALFRLHVRSSEGGTIDTLQPPARQHDSVQGRCVRSDEPTSTPARLGISVSKRVAAHAVERNRIKRIARDSFRRIRLRLPPGDYVLLAQRDAAGASSEALRAALASLWQRASALKTMPATPTIPPRAPDTATDPS